MLRDARCVVCGDRFKVPNASFEFRVRMGLEFICHNCNGVPKLRERSQRQFLDPAVRCTDSSLSVWLSARQYHGIHRDGEI